MSLDLRTILMPYVRRAVAALAVAAFLGALLFRCVRRSGWPRSVVCGTAAASVGLAAAWLVDAPPVAAAIAAPMLLFAAPELLWTLARRRRRAASWRLLAAWSVACLPTAFLVQPLF
ncbi:MAG: hypothetical protein JSW67_06075 [Candidatus Latescibacterota bacterium]|nr:MAG: hypothetical protein JSW67_06075 [Candidatus Latescibacterota bacterium]